MRALPTNCTTESEIALLVSQFGDDSPFVQVARAAQCPPSSKPAAATSGDIKTGMLWLGGLVAGLAVLAVVDGAVMHRR